MVVIVITKRDNTIEVLTAAAICIDKDGFQFWNATISSDVSSGIIHSGRYNPPLGSTVVIS